MANGPGCSKISPLEITEHFKKKVDVKDLNKKNIKFGAVLANMLVINLGFMQMGLGLTSWANVSMSFAAMYDWDKEDQKNFDVILTGVLVAGSGIGAYLSGSLMKFGKLRVILIMNLILIASILICMMNNILLICFGRFFWGFTYGVFTAVCGKYTFETCPMEYFGPLGGLCQLNISCGVFIMSLVGLGVPPPPLDKDTWVVQNWWIVTWLVPLVIAIL